MINFLKVLKNSISFMKSINDVLIYLILSLTRLKVLSKVA